MLGAMRHLKQKKKPLWLKQIYEYIKTLSREAY